MTTSPGPGTGSGTSSHRTTSGPPGSVMTTARMYPSCVRQPGVPSLPSPGHLLNREAGIATECHHSGALGIEIVRDLAYARRDVRTRPAGATHHEDQEGPHVTMKNDTPQIFGEDAPA